jgi:hypothetical protein
MVGIRGGIHRNQAVHAPVSYLLLIASQKGSPVSGLSWKVLIRISAFFDEILKKYGHCFG